MNKLRRMIVFASCTLALSAFAAGGDQPGMAYESFEHGVPAYYSATRPGSLSLCPWHYKHGTNSLRWDWVKDEELVIRHGIGDPTRVGGFLSRASFVVWVYMEKPVPDTLVFAFRKGDAVTGSFRFPLQFTGWRQARLHYDSFPDGRPTADVDNIRITTTGTAARGTVFLDSINYNTLTYYSASIDPEKAARRRIPVPDKRRFPKPERVTDAEREGIRKLEDVPAKAKPGLSEAQVSNLYAKVGASGIVRDEHGVRGPGLLDGGDWPDELGPKDSAFTAGAASGLAGAVAGAWRASTNESQRARLAETFFVIADYLQDQGQSLSFGTVILMRDLLARTGRLDSHLAVLIYSKRYGSGAFFVGEEERVISNMDFYAYDVRGALSFCFAQADVAEQVRWLNAWKAMLERSMLQPSSSLKIDGSAYHHGGHYPSYSQNAFVFLPGLIEKLRGTPWQLCAEAHERLRRAVLAQRFYCNLRDKPISLSGRSPFATDRVFIGITPGYGDGAFYSLARLGTPDGRQSVDREVAAAYLRLVPKAATEEFYRNLGIQPEPDPVGTFVMPYAALLCHRRDNWLAAVKGQSKYCWGSERQGQRNAYGLFQGLGNLEILAGGNPVTAKASGREGAGWDWRRFEGTTTLQLPLKEIDKAWGTVSGVTFSPETFAGGLSHQGQQGVFAMILNQLIMPEKNTLKGRKSWFFIDDQIVCLGSDISCDETNYPTQTTLCQKTLLTGEPGKFLPTLLNGSDFAAFPEERALDKTSPHWFIDVQQTGYYLPAGQNATVARRHQVSRDVDDAKDTEGNFLTAWLDHGKAPKAASYEYMLVVRATPERMQKIAAEPPYQVVQRDQAAHVIRHTASGRWGCAFFVPQEVAPLAVGAETLPVKAVDRPCLIMAEPIRDGRLDLSAADPDLNLENEANQPRPLRISIRGNWRLLKATGRICAWPLPEATDNVRILSANAEETVLEIVCQHGASYDISLAR